MKVGDHVTKPQGYNFDGEVVAVFTNKAGEQRVVVEFDLSPGMLHIFHPKQLVVVKEK